MKKFLAILLVLCLVFALAACGSNSAEDAGNAQDNGGESATDSKVLRVGMECAYAPYNWTQSTDANGAVQINGSSDYANGYDVMMAKYLAEQMGCEVEIHKIAWDSLPVAVQSGTIDCVIAGQSITSERLETVDFTTPYYYASIIALVRSDSPYANAKTVADLAGATCTSQINTIWYDGCLPQIPDANILPPQEEVATMLVALDSGTCDGVVTDQPTALNACAVYPDLVMLDLSAGDFEVSEEDINIGISVQKGNTELLDALNAGLATLTEDDFLEWMKQAIEMAGQL